MILSFSSFLLCCKGVAHHWNVTDTFCFVSSFIPVLTQRHRKLNGNSSQKWHRTLGDYTHTWCDLVLQQLQIQQSLTRGQRIKLNSTSPPEGQVAPKMAASFCPHQLHGAAPTTYLHGFLQTLGHYSSWNYLLPTLGCVQRNMYVSIYTR